MDGSTLAMPQREKVITQGMCLPVANTFPITIRPLRVYHTSLSPSLPAGEFGGVPVSPLALCIGKGGSLAKLQCADIAADGSTGQLCGVDGMPSTGTGGGLVTRHRPGELAGAMLRLRQ